MLQSSRGMAYQANHTILSSGQILFSDSTKPWDPSTDFPKLPSTNIGITAIGQIEDRNVSTLYLTNAIQYANFEPLNVRPSLVKTLQINAGGKVTYEETKVGLVSTVSDAFSSPINGFGDVLLGAPAINDVFSSPDTITNALAKIDGWITNAFLLQPPTVAIVETEKNSLFGGVRWENFKTYNVMNNSVPYVNSLLFIIGDPASANYCTFEILNSMYFPYKSYSDGISPNLYPIVRLRIFTDFFFSNADVIFSKQLLPFNCIRILTEEGHAKFPQTGKVLAIEHTNGETSYTTISVYLPDLPKAYSKNSPIPVKIAYLNKTEGQVNVAYASTIQATVGGPSALSHINCIGATCSTINLQMEKPIYSDELHGISTPFLSTYNINYTGIELNSAHKDGIGFRYGTPINVIPADYIAYSNATYTQSLIYSDPVQSISLTGDSSHRLVPGMRWSTCVETTNSAKILGINTAGPIVSTLFPTTFKPKISSVEILNISPAVRVAGKNNTIAYTAGWNIVTSTVKDVFYAVSAGTPLSFKLSTAVQFNDETYPGDRNEISISAKYIDRNSAIITNTLDLNTAGDDFTLNTLLTTTVGQIGLSTIISDTESVSIYEKYYYKANVSGNFTVAYISPGDNSVSVNIKNRNIPNFNADIIEQNFSTNYKFVTEPYNQAAITSVVYTTDVIASVPVSGLYTPAIGAEFMFDIHGSNFAYNYIGSNFGTGELLLGGAVISPIQSYTSSVRIYNGTTEVITLPIPQNTNLHLSTCRVKLNSNVYHNQIEPVNFDLRGTLNPANPIDTNLSFINTLTPSLFIDTVSQYNMGQFTSPEGEYGQRVLSWLPRLETPGTINNMNDGVSAGNIGTGLNVSISSFYIIESNYNIMISSANTYQHSSSISSFYTDIYSRELIYTNGMYMHPAGYNFSVFNSVFLQVPTALYPDFTHDLVDPTGDVNHGHRYASFAYLTPSFPVPTAQQYVKITLQGIQVGETTTTREDNNVFPNAPVIADNIQYMKTRMHVKLIGIHNPLTNEPFETGWINCWKIKLNQIFDDTIYDVGGAVAVNHTPSGWEYTVQINRRFYTNVLVLVRIGIAQDGSLYSGSLTGQQLSFTSVSVNLSDDSTVFILPSAPTSISASSLPTAIQVAFSEGYIGSASILNYEYSINAGASFTAFYPIQNASPVLIGGLTNGTVYTIQLRAVNSGGAGEASISVLATPTA